MPEDAELMTALRGDAAAMARVERSFGPVLLRLARRHVASDDVAHEVVQETWLAAWTGHRRFEGRCAPRTWLLRILHNRARTRGARDARVVPLSSLPDDAAPRVGERVPPWGAGAPSDPLAHLLDGEVRRAVAGALTCLPPRQAAVVRRRIVDGDPSEQVAADLGVSDVNQRVLLHRGRVGLRAALAPLAA